MNKHLLKTFFTGIILVWPLISNAYFYHQIQTEYKAGSRHIGRLNILTSLYGTSKNLLYIDAIGVITSKDTKEGNLGLGYRHIVSMNSVPFIAGSYLFYDARKTQNNNIGHQITGGIELLNTFGEFRINGYFPVGKKTFTLNTQDGVVHDNTNIYFGKKNRVEKILGGFDVEAGAKIPRLPINAYISFYHFSRNSVKVNGVRPRVEYKPLRWLVAGGEYSYDKIRKHNWYLSIGTRIAISSNSNKLHSPFTIKGKITQPPIRDIDIMTADTDEFQDIKIATIVTSAEGLKKAIQDGKTEIVIINDIDFQGEVITNQYGSLSAPIKNTKIAGVKVTKSGNTILKTEFHPVSLLNYTVQQAVGAQVIVNIGGIDYTAPGGLFPYIESTEISYLITNNVVVDDSGAHIGSHLVGFAKNSHIHHIENKSIVSTECATGVVWFADNSTIENNINNGAITSREGTGIAFILYNGSKARDNKNYGAIEGENASGIAGLLANSSTAEDNKNFSGITGDGAVGISGVLRSKSKLLRNENFGTIWGDEAAGITALLRDDSLAQDNKNYGSIAGDNSGIANELSGTAVAQGNINNGEVLGANATGTIKFLTENSEALKNINNGTISADNASGIIFEISDTAKAKDNINNGTVSGDNSAGVIYRMGNTSKAISNKNTSVISGNLSAGLIGGLNDNAIAENNANTGQVTGFGSTGTILLTVPTATSTNNTTV